MSTAAAMSDLETDDDAVVEDPRVLQALERKRRHLQTVVAIAALAPVVVGLYGILFGPALTGDRLGLSGDSHYRFLSGLYLGIGLLFWSTIPNIEAVGPRFRLLTLLVFVGGLSRFLGMSLTSVPSLSMLAALAAELLLAPLLCLWQWRVARGYLVQEKKPPPRRKAPPADSLPSPMAPPAGQPSAAGAPGPDPLVPPDDIPAPPLSPAAGIRPAAGSEKGEPAPAPSAPLPQDSGRTPDPSPQAPPPPAAGISRAQ